MIFSEQILARLFTHKLYGPSGWRSLVAVLSLLLSLTVTAESRSLTDLNALEGQLQGLGWQTERTSEGDLLLWPPGQQQQPGADVGNVTTIKNLESLENQLRATGWRTRMSDDGSLLIDVKPQPDAPKSQGAPPPWKADWLEEMGQLLKNRGWRVERDQSGSLKAYPRSAEASPSSDVSLLKVDKGNLDQLRQSLLAAGWRLERGADGSLLLYPRSSAVFQQHTQTRSEKAETVFVDLVPSARIRLPVDSLRKAYRIASVWLERQRNSELKIGRIERLHWVYLVDVVQSTRPFSLHNQLAIRYRDGLLVPLL